MNEDVVDTLQRQITLLTIQNRHLSSLLDEQTKHHTDLENRLSINDKTGLPNHLKLSNDLSGEIELSNSAGSQLKIAIVLAKLDDKYSLLAKTMRSSVSEWILYQIGQRIREEIPSSDSIYHTRDDEFAIILRGVTGSETLSARVSKILDAIQRPHVFSGYHVTIGANAGVALYPDHGIEKGRLLHSADIALENSRTRRIVASVYDEGMRQTVVEKIELQNSIIKALEAQALEEISRQFLAFYQPIVKITSFDGNSVKIARFDAEVLIRWNHPEKGLLGPSSFIPIAEETGLILPIGNWILYKAVDTLARWDAKGIKDSFLSVNISPKQFSNDHFFGNVTRVVKNSKKIKGRLKLELTESCLMDDPAGAIERIKSVAAEGIAFSVDDFGTGYSSLSYLSRLPVSCIKIDKSFVTNITESKQDRAIVRGVIALAREMGFEIVCEGVENIETMRILFEEGCDTIQGFVFSKPVPETEFLALRQKALEGKLSLSGLAELSS